MKLYTAKGLVLYVNQYLLKVRRSRQSFQLTFARLSNETCVALIRALF